VFLIDTNVVSELRKPRPHPSVVAWLQAVPERNLFLSAVTIGELQRGVEITRRQDVAKAAEIESWVQLIAESWNVLPMDARVFRRWATLMDGRSDDLTEDAMIAATAFVHQLTVVTRNLKDFTRLGVKALDPFTFSVTAAGTQIAVS
jgi:toxin FitB